MPRKQTERFQLERFIFSDPRFAGAEIKDHERPDFIVEKQGYSFGIEVTQLYRPAVSGSFGPREVEAFREKIVGRARDIYLQRGASAVDVGVMFSNTPYASTQLEPLADELATFVQRAYPLDGSWVIYTDDDNTSNMPTAFAILRISKHETGGPGFWSMAQCEKRALLDRTIIQEAIDAKNRLVPEYRRRIPEVWLLLVMDPFYLSSSFTVSEEIVREPYSCVFDRAVLFSLVDGRSWPLMLRPT